MTSSTSKQTPNRNDFQIVNLDGFAKGLLRDHQPREKKNMIRLLLKNGMTLSLTNKLKLSEISKNSLLKGLIDPYKPEDSEKLSQRQENEEP